MNKKCGTCLIEKDTSEFNRDKNRPDGYYYQCKACRKLYYNNYYATSYGDKQRAAERRRDAIKRSKIKTIILEYKKSKTCSMCSEADPVCLQFHHRDPKIKDFTIAGSHRRSWNSIESEINKCIILCANCHLKLHASIRGGSV